MTVLAISSLALTAPLYIFTIQENKNMYETVLAGLLSVNTGLSVAFWMNPVRHSRIHRYDGRLGKLTFVAVSGYVLWVKPRIGFISSLVSSGVLFYVSDVLSNRRWCSREHLCIHFLFHLCIGIGSLFAFI